MRNRLKTMKSEVLNLLLDAVELLRDQIILKKERRKLEFPETI